MRVQGVDKACVRITLQNIFDLGYPDYDAQAKRFIVSG